MDDLFKTLKPDIEALAQPLFDATQAFFRKRGAFLPHGAVLEADGNVRMVMAAPDGDLETPRSSLEILPLLHEVLRAQARQQELAAVAVCEDVTITPGGSNRTKAVKVLVEHRRGLTVALYLPWRRRLLRPSVFGDVMVIPAQPEVSPWGDLANIER